MSLLLLVGLLGLGQVGEPDRTTALLKTRVIEEYPPALVKLERFYLHARGSATDEEQRVYDDQPRTKENPRPKIVGGIGGNPLPMTVVRIAKHDFAFNGPLARYDSRRVFTKVLVNDKEGRLLFEETNDPKKIPPLGVYCNGEAGSFMMSRTRESDAWRVNSVGNPAEVNAVLDRTIRASFFSPFRIQKIRILDLIKDPSFTFRKITESKEDDQTLLRIDFLVNHHDKRMFPFRNGWFMVSPGQGWLLRRFELATPDYPRDGDCEISYAPVQSPQEIPFPTSVRLRDPWSVTTWTFDKVVHEEVPAGEFSLTAFGLPDIAKPIAEQTPGRSSRWYFIAAGIGLAAAVCFRFFAIRSASKARTAAAVDHRG